MTRRHSLLDSPIGTITVVAEDGVLAALYMTDHRHAPPADTFGDQVEDAVPGLREELAEYFAGQRRTFEVPLAESTGTQFQQRVWRGLAEIPYGETWTYRQLAEHVGSPGASRAVGLANGRNPISIVVPCHRVIGADGSLTGYGGGMERKRFLLELEGAIRPAAGMLL